MSDIKLEICTPTNALEVITGTLPFWLQLQEILASEYLRIMRKQPQSQVKELVIECTESASSQSNPAKLMKVSIRDTSRKVDLKYLDPEPVYSEDNMDFNIRKSMVNRGKDLGSSKNRTDQQKLLTAQYSNISGAFLQTLCQFLLMARPSGTLGPVSVPQSSTKMASQVTQLLSVSLLQSNQLAFKGKWRQ